MTALLTLTRAQAKVFLREPTAVAFGLVFPSVLLMVIGTVFPDATVANAALGGRSLVDIYAPTAIVLGLATVAVSMLPAALGTDRERGILRRLATTPAHPGTLVAAHLVVQVAVVTCAAVAAITVGVVVFDLPVPRSPGWFVVAYALGVVALLALGLLIGALVPTAGAGQAVGMLVYFPLLFFAGVYVPLEVMPDGVRAAAAWTPAGAAVQAMTASWAGTPPTTTSLLVLAGSAVLAGGVAVVGFRWES